MAELNTISIKAEYDVSIKGSMFKSIVVGTDSPRHIKKIINKYKIKYNKASHVCYAYRICDNYDLFNNPIIVEYSTDAGEPSGTAGKPILNVLKSCNVINSVLIVVRYFGGTKLGISGLIEAYKRASIGVLDNAVFKKWKIYEKIKIVYAYKIQKIINKQLLDFDCIDIVSKYDENITTSFKIEIKNKKDMLNIFNEKSNGTILIVE
tara:strand:+ start:138 stop:758 length:621 start_codon:yes stop_codon:yes gene_type:complete